MGLPSLAFVFHERYRNDYRFDCRGLGEWHGRTAWLVDFQQRPDRKSRIRGYDVQDTLYPVSLKGRAWIAADSFEVMRMEADTMKPVPQINLRDEHQTIQYAPVHFRTGDTETMASRQRRPVLRFSAPQVPSRPQLRFLSAVLGEREPENRNAEAGGTEVAGRGKRNARLCLCLESRFDFCDTLG